MKRLSNLPPGVTDQMIEDAQRGETAEECAHRLYDEVKTYSGGLADQNAGYLQEESRAILREMGWRVPADYDANKEFRPLTSDTRRIKLG